MNGQTQTLPQPGITFWQIVGSLIFVFILLILLPSWVVIIVAGIPLAMGLAGLLNRWFGASESATRWIVTIAAIAFIGSVGWNWGERQYPWVFENLKIHGMWRSFQTTQALDPQQPLGLHKSVYDTRRDRLTHKQQAWIEVLQNLRTGANPSSAYLEGMLQKAGLLDEISAAAEEKISVGTLTADDVILEAEAQRTTLQQQLEKIRLTPPANTAAKPWWNGITTGRFPVRLLILGLILLVAGTLVFRRLSSGFGGLVVLLGGIAIVWGIFLLVTPEIAPAPPGTRPTITAPRRQATATHSVGGREIQEINILPGTWSPRVVPPSDTRKFRFRGPEGTLVRFADGSGGPVTKNFGSSSRWAEGFSFFSPSTGGKVVVVFDKI